MSIIDIPARGFDVVVKGTDARHLAHVAAGIAGHHARKRGCRAVRVGMQVDTEANHGVQVRAKYAYIKRYVRNRT